MKNDQKFNEAADKRQVPMIHESHQEPINTKHEGAAFFAALWSLNHHMEDVASSLVELQSLGEFTMKFRIAADLSVQPPSFRSYIYDIEFTELNELIGQFLDEIDRGDYPAAHQTYQSIWAQRKMQYPDMSEGALSRSLEIVYEAIKSRSAPITFSRLAEFSENNPNWKEAPVSALTGSLPSPVQSSEEDFSKKITSANKGERV